MSEIFGTLQYIFFYVFILIVPDDLTLKYPFFNVASFDILENGWQAYTTEAEMSRYKDCAEEWRLTYVNKDYKVNFSI